LIFSKAYFFWLWKNQVRSYLSYQIIFDPSYQLKFLGRMDPFSRFSKGQQAINRMGLHTQYIGTTVGQIIGIKRVKDWFC
jgi:hypothetical protein